MLLACWGKRKSRTAFINLSFSIEILLPKCLMLEMQAAVHLGTYVICIEKKKKKGENYISLKC